MSSEIVAAGAGVRFLFDRLERPLTPTLARFRRGVTEAWGLADVSFTARAGEAIALIGPSGAGKTTLLRAIAGIVAPDTGTLRVSGRIGALLATDAGLLGALTGRDNARLIGVLQGIGRVEARQALAQVHETTQLGSVFDRPVSSYSEGMRARVGFAVAIEARPDILVLDEVHEALDHEFRAIVERTAGEILARGGIVIAAGHDHPLLETICTRAFLMERGRLVRDGPFAAVQAAYLG